MLERAILLGALALDLAFGEPPARVHPVVWIGKLIAWLERAPVVGRAGQFAYGVWMVLFGLVASVGPVSLLLAWLRRRLPLVYVVLGAFLLKSAFSVRGLFVAAELVRRPLAAGQLAQARVALRALVSRDPSDLSAPLVAAATVESVAENSSDSLVAPLFYFAVGGVPAALAYRVANTFDSMIGYRGRYEYLGKFAARLDDVLSFVPARLTALLLIIASSAYGRASQAWRGARRYAGATESPNAGWPMSAMAGALGVRLEKVGHYRLGDGRPPDAAAVRRAEETAGIALALAALLAILFLEVRGGRRT
ncbi:MAG: adenosylcobinamide-phosphate synthase CbiB [Chloroflexota bacterium]